MAFPALDPNPSFITFDPTMGVHRFRNYPDHPKDSRPLPLTRKREYLFALDQAAMHAVHRAVNEKQRFSFTDVVSQEAAIGIVEGLVRQCKEKLGPFLISEERVRAERLLDQLKPQSFQALTGQPHTRKVYETATLLFIQWVNDAILENPQAVSRSPLSLSWDDFKMIGVDGQAFFNNGCTAACQDFVFYMLNEVQAFPLLLSPERKPWPEELTLKPCEFLSKWGYTLVQTPEPGDLVVYCSTLEGFLKAKHFGIWTPHQKVLSKVGVGEVIEHSLEDVMASYGNFVFFFRQPIRSSLARTFLKELEKEDLKSLLARECFNRMLQLFEKLPITQVLGTSLYNQKYNQEMRATILQKMTLYSLLIRPETNAATVLGSLKSIVLNAMKAWGKFE